MPAEDDNLAWCRLSRDAPRRPAVGDDEVPVRETAVERLTVWKDGRCVVCQDKLKRAVGADELVIELGYGDELARCFFADDERAILRRVDQDGRRISVVETGDGVACCDDRMVDKIRSRGHGEVYDLIRPLYDSEPFVAIRFLVLPNRNVFNLHNRAGE